MASIFTDTLGGGANILGIGAGALSLVMIIGIIILAALILRSILHARAAMRERWRYKQEAKIATEEERESAEFPRKMEEERIENILEQEDKTLMQKKQMMISNFSYILKNPNIIPARAIPYIENLGKMIAEQENFFSKEFRLESEERIEDVRKKKKLKWVARLKKTNIRGELKESALIAKGRIAVAARNSGTRIANFVRRKVGFEENEERAVMAEEHLTAAEAKDCAKSITLIKNLTKILRKQLKLIGQIEQAYKQNVPPVKLSNLGRKLYNLFVKETNMNQKIIADEHIEQNLERTEEGYTKQLNVEAREISSWERQEALVFGARA